MRNNNQGKQRSVKEGIDCTGEKSELELGASNVKGINPLVTSWDVNSCVQCAFNFKPYVQCALTPSDVSKNQLTNQSMKHSTERAKLSERTRFRRWFVLRVFPGQQSNLIFLFATRICCYHVRKRSRNYSVSPRCRQVRRPPNVFAGKDERSIAAYHSGSSGWSRGLRCEWSHFSGCRKRWDTLCEFLCCFSFWGIPYFFLNRQLFPTRRCRQERIPSIWLISRCRSRWPQRTWQNCGIQRK